VPPGVGRLDAQYGGIALKVPELCQQSWSAGCAPLPSPAVHEFKHVAPSPDADDCLPLPAAMPVSSGPSSEGPSDLFWRGLPPALPYGGSTRFYGGSTRRQGSSGLVRRAAAAVRELPGSSGRLSPCLPDDGAPRRGCRRPVLACSSIPADHDHRFRRSGARTGHAARAAPPLFACGMRIRAALVVLA
jgi:hypothetical protein